MSHPCSRNNSLGITVHQQSCGFLPASPAGVLTDALVHDPPLPPFSADGEMNSAVPNDILGKLAARCPVLSPVVLAPGEPRAPLATLPPQPRAILLSGFVKGSVHSQK